MYEDIFKEFIFDMDGIYPVGSMALLYEDMGAPTHGEWELVGKVDFVKHYGFDGSHTMGVAPTTPIESVVVICAYKRIK